MHSLGRETEGKTVRIRPPPAPCFPCLLGQLPDARSVLAMSLLQVTNAYPKLARPPHTSTQHPMVACVTRLKHPPNSYEQPKGDTRPALSPSCLQLWKA